MQVAVCGRAAVLCLRKLDCGGGLGIRDHGK